MSELPRVCLLFKMIVVLMLCFPLLFISVVALSITARITKNSYRTVSVIIVFSVIDSYSIYISLFCIKYHISLLHKYYNTIKDKNGHSFFMGTAILSTYVSFPTFALFIGL
jgi:hypothetical protein